MKRYPCPHCGDLTITFWRRLWLGPAFPARCPGCGGRVGVPWSRAWLGFLSAFAGALIPQILLGFRRELSIATRMLIVGALIGIFALLMSVWWRKVPLEKR
jgi:hypothetical protein